MTEPTIRGTPFRQFKPRTNRRCDGCKVILEAKSAAWKPSKNIGGFKPEVVLCNDCVGERQAVDRSAVHRKTFNTLLDEMKKEGRPDLEIAQFLAGMKLGFYTGTKVSKEDALACATLALEFQKQLDPGGVTWEK